MSATDFGAVGKQVQLHVGVLGGGAGQHRADQARLRTALRQRIACSAARRCARSVSPCDVGGEQALVLGQRGFDLGILGSAPRRR